jgi:hypothetical protein
MSFRFSRTALVAALVVAALSASAQTEPTRSAKLDQALEAIVPTPYAIELDRRVPRDWVVHWTPGAGNWMKVLQDALEPMGLKVEADWVRSVIRVSYRSKLPMAAALPSPALRSASAESASAPASAPSSGGPALEVKPGSYLHETLLEWSARAGWSLYWGLGDDVDFRLEVGAKYPSDFKDAVHKLFDSLPESMRIKAELRVDNSPPLLYVTRDEGGR